MTHELGRTDKQHAAAMIPPTLLMPRQVSVTNIIHPLLILFVSLCVQPIQVDLLLITVPQIISSIITSLRMPVVSMLVYLVSLSCRDRVLLKELVQAHPTHLHLFHTNQDYR